MSKPVSSAEIRSAFLEFFRARGHEVVPSSPLVPANDPTLLFTNAGMVQFKEAFLGQQQRAVPRAVSSQRCVRAGGKHNDLENVGYTARHHTFFEMLGNFSFGDYFKREAIAYAWELLTGVFGLPAERLWVTVYEDDDEAAAIWLEEIGVDPARFSRCGEADNFWAMGDTGPCGPCTEVFYDHGPAVAGGPPGTPEADGDRYVEIWNLVFMQYERSADGGLSPMPKTGVDTGMGLERIAAVQQGVHSNYETDMFRALIAAAADIAGGGELDRASLQVIADHIRACAFLIVDGVLPGNEGRGYVLRRIIRRAVRHGSKLGLDEPFFHRLVAPLEQQMGEAYPELAANRAMVERVLRQEEERFAETLAQGLGILERAIAGMSGSVIPGATVFQLYDTYGFPVDLTADIARERGLSLDMAGFEREMQAQRERARAASRFAAGDGQAVPAEALAPYQGGFEFTGYDRLEDRAEVLAIFHDGEPVERARAGEAATVVLARTPFYAEAGGQVGDAGQLTSASGVFEVRDTRKQAGVHLHIGEVKLGELRAGETVECQVSSGHREPTRLNHSATHLLHAALRKVLGEHVQQKGSLVAPDRLRFDFSHAEPASAAELEAIEDMVNAEIRHNVAVETRIMPIEKALEAGALALFGEKYDEQVRVLSMGDFSIELCGGTHVARTGDIGLFKIIAESGVAAGVRRIEALTGAAAFAHLRRNEQKLEALAQTLKAGVENVEQRAEQLVARQRELEREVEALKARLSSQQGSELADEAVDIAGIKVLSARLEGADASALRETVDQMKNKLGTGAVVLGTVDGQKVRLAAGVTKNATDRLAAGALVNHVARQVGGKGGGRPDMAQAGGTEPGKLDAALASVGDWVREQLSQGS